jgi:MYXO-CTERM domain-containing protein
MASIRNLFAVFLMAPAAVLTAGMARADGVGALASSLRPAQHVDKYGRLLEDVCPARSGNQRRCFAERIVDPQRRHQRTIRPAAGGGGGSDPNCQQQGGGGGGSSPPQASMTPTDVLTAYNIPASAKAGGKIVALVELPSVNALADVNAYRAQFNIPALAACPTSASGVPTPNGTACFARVGTDGTVNSVSSTDCPGWSGETGLDMDMVSAACPDCSIVLVEGNTTTDLDQMNAVAATVVHASAASNSWGGPEQQDDETPYNNSGILTLAASGDQGYLDEAFGNGQGVGANFPASSQYVLAVGGTTLSNSGGGYSEVVWNDGAQGGAGGSGCSMEFPTPSWQSSSGISFGSCMMRASVDVSAAAEFGGGQGGGGIAAYDADDGGWNAVVGTSAATPLVAAILVRIGLAGADQHELLYKNISAFNDVTSGSNDNDNICSDLMCTAGTGWDGPTGLGSPNATKLAALAGATPPPPPPPPADAGAPPGDDASAPPTTDSGSSQGTGPGSPPGTGEGSGTGTGGGTAPYGGSLGSSCSSASDCNSGECEAPPLSGANVCTQSCSGFVSACPSGFSCEGGYCFPGGASSSSSSGGGGAKNADAPDYAPKSQGCAVSANESGTSGAELGWVAVGLAFMATRRRKRH